MQSKLSKANEIGEEPCINQLWYWHPCDTMYRTFSIRSTFRGKRTLQVRRSDGRTYLDASGDEVCAATPTKER